MGGLRVDMDDSGARWIMDDGWVMENGWIMEDGTASNSNSQYLQNTIDKTAKSVSQSSVDTIRPHKSG
jgi:hypothetical protein